MIGCSSSSISIVWQAPAIIKSQHALIEEYMVVHQDVSINKRNNNIHSNDDPNSEGNWNSAKGYQPEDDVDMLYTTNQKMTISNLRPSTGHSFLLLSRSAAGWSKPSAKLVHFTLPDVPSEPSKVELLKVNKNGLVVSWHAPLIDNGCKVVLYQLEMTDREPMVEDDCDEDDLSVEVSVAHSEGGVSIDASSIASSSLATRSQGQKEMKDADGGWHRLVKHRQVDVLEKYLMGLEFERKYYFRCQCKNEVGWSRWGDWSGPYIPQVNTNF